MISALLLAAGQSSRMHYQPKALLTFNGSSFVRNAVQKLASAGLDEIIVVTGAERAAIWDEASSAGIRLHEAFNKSYHSGLLSSIQCGLEHCDPRSQAALITLVDLPFLTSEDYRSVKEIWQRGDPKLFVRAMSAEQPGHPVIIPRSYFCEIFEQPLGDWGCAFLFQEYPERVRYHEVSGGHIDIDMMEDYYAHITP